MKGKDREGHKELLQRMWGKFEGWKTRCFLRVERIMPAQSVLGSLKGGRQRVFREWKE